MKSNSTINLAITECTIVKALNPVIDIKGVCHLNTVYQYASFRFQLLKRLANIPSKE